MSYMSIGIDVGTALQLICQGNHFASKGNNVEAAEKAYWDAIEIYKNVLVKCPGIEYEKELYRTYKKLGTLYHTAGNFDKAVHTYKEIIEHLEKLICFDRLNADSYKLKIASTSLICISILDSSEEKQLLLEKAIKYLEEVNCDNTLLAISYKTKGDLLQEDSEKCREAYLKALRIAENEKNDEICEEVANELKGLIRTFE